MVSSCEKEVQSLLPHRDVCVYITCTRVRESRLCRHPITMKDQGHEVLVTLRGTSFPKEVFDSKSTFSN